MVSKIIQQIQGDLALDRYSNSLSHEHSGSIKYTDDIELTHCTYIHAMFRYTELTNTTNQKSCVVEEYRPTLKLHPLSLYR